jgi:Tol biopolymer transport system component
MTLRSGTRLGHYEILSAIGAGGMGEVYKARDRRLDRFVAIKVLPAHVASDRARRERFEREARAVARLNHPHICALHDVGREDTEPGTVDFLVMEYLEGGTLADRLSKGPLPPDQILRYAIQIADALEKAHAQGVVHRDLKPANIALPRTGVKLLDFGLAKSGSAEGEASPLISSLPTQEQNLTAEGAIVGTLQYMAPEQLEGKEADARTDLFALGAVVHEMATGHKAFSGRSPASLIAAILTAEPAPVSSLQSLTPRALDHVVMKCLSKDPDDRWQTAHDVRLELEWILEEGRRGDTLDSKIAPAKTRERLAWILAGGCFVAAVVALAVSFFARSRTPEGVHRFQVFPPENTRFVGGPAFFSVSPDGRSLAFLADTEGTTRIWVRPFDSLEARLIPGTDGAWTPFWSPDSRFIGFFTEGKLKKVEAAGGLPQTVCERSGFGGTWSEDGVIVFPSDSVLYRVSADGGDATPVTSLDASREEQFQSWPHFLPDGHQVLYFSSGARGDDSGLYVASLDASGGRRLDVAAESNGVYSAPGQIVFSRGGALMAQPFDARRLQVTGEAVPLAGQVGINGVRAAFSISGNGVLAYRSGTVPETELVWYQRTGTRLGSVGAPGRHANPAISPDEKRMAVDRVDPRTRARDIWLLDLARGGASRFSFAPGTNLQPLWAPDGSQIAFLSNREGQIGIYVRPSSGAGEEEALLITPNGKDVLDWTPDGRFLVFLENSPNTGWDLWLLPVEADRKAVPLLQTQFQEFDAQFSPDGRWIAYGSDESGRWEVYVQSFPLTGAKWQISTSGGFEPRWKHDGTELFYLTLEATLMAVEVKGDASRFEAGVTRPLFPISITEFGNDRNHYVVTADGERFLVNSVEESAAVPITVVLNWTEELKR